MKKRVIALLLCMLMIFSFAACGGKTESGAEEETTVQQDSSDKAENDNKETEKSDKKDSEKQTEEVTEEKKKEINGVFGEFTSTDVNGEKVNADIFKGKKVTMVNIWGTFCSPCIGEMPDLQKLNEDYSDKGFQVVGIVCDVYEGEDTATAKDVIKQTGVKYLNVLTSDSLVNAKLGEVMSVPETLFIDEKGNQIGKNYVGSRSYDDWAEIIDSVLAEVK